MDELQVLRKENERLKKENERLKSKVELYEFIAEQEAEMQKTHEECDKLAKEIRSKEALSKELQEKLRARLKKPVIGMPSFVEIFRSKFNSK